jgi:penicillin amidase
MRGMSRRIVAASLFVCLVVPFASGCSVDEGISCVPGGATCPAEFEGLSAEVRILRDDIGVVHVYGATDTDVSYGSGYAQAADRLFQMDLARRRALGRQAEVLGPGPAGEDEFIRTLDIPRWGRENLELVRVDRPDIYQLLVAWTAGVNRRIEQVRSGAVPLPYGFGPDELDYLPEPWAIADTVSIGKLILFGNASSFDFEILATVLRDYFPELAAAPLYAPFADAFVLPPEERPAGSAALWHAPTSARPARQMPEGAEARLRQFVEAARPRPGGSNNWAIEGRHTDTGRPIIAGDPHQELRSPSVMWAHHMNSADAGGTIDAVGFNFVGAPGVQLGHNRHVAWTATTTYPDVMDLWSVAIEGGVAKLGGADVPVETRTESIVVKGEPTRTLEVIDVPGYGVVLPDGLAPVPVTGPGERLLLGWPGFRATHDVEAFSRMGSATDLESMEAAVDLMETGNFNFVSASAEGISYRSSPLVPDRGLPDEDMAPFAILDGADPKAMWTGEYLPLEVMPHSRGGERGWIASANNDPFGFTGDGKLVGDPFYFGVFFDPGTRAARIEQEIARLVGEGPISVEDAQRLQTDVHSLLADELVPAIEEVYATVPTDPALAAYVGRADLAAMVADISAWNGDMTRDSTAALAFHVFMHSLTKRAVADEFSLAFDPIANQSPIYMLKFGLQVVLDKYPGSEAFLQEGRALLIMQALDDAAAFLAARFGPGATWGDWHATRFSGLWGDALDGGSVPTDGADGTVNVSAARFFDGDVPVQKLESGSGAVFRIVATFDDDGVPRATVAFPRGNSGDPASPYFSDRLEEWVEGEYRPLRFKTAEVESSSTTELVLSP